MEFRSLRSVESVKESVKIVNPKVGIGGKC